ncbi:MAG: AAA family ATPase, partial [Georgenia sp.]
MARSIYIASSEGYTGKSAVALGLVDLFVRRVEKVGIFRPVTRSGHERDTVVDMLLGHGGVSTTYEDAVAVTYEDVHADPEAALSAIVHKYRAVERDNEVVIIVGSDYTDVSTPAELAFNARVAANLGAPVLLVVSAMNRTPEEVRQVAELSVAEITADHASTVGVFANRCRPEELDVVLASLAATGLAAWAVPEVALLSAPVVRDLMVALDGELLTGEDAMLDREAEHLLVSGMNTEHVLERLRDGQLA